MVKNPPANAGDAGRRHGFDPWVGKVPWRREWQPTPLFLPGESHRQRSLASYNPWGSKESDTARTHACTRACTHTHTHSHCIHLRGTVHPVCDGGASPIQMGTLVEASRQTGNRIWGLGCHPRLFPTGLCGWSLHPAARDSP